MAKMKQTQLTITNIGLVHLSRIELLIKSDGSNKLIQVANRIAIVQAPLDPSISIDVRQDKPRCFLCAFGFTSDKHPVEHIC